MSDALKIEKAAPVVAQKEPTHVPPPEPNRFAWSEPRKEVKVSKLPNGSISFDF